MGWDGKGVVVSSWAIDLGGRWRGILDMGGILVGLVLRYSGQITGISNSRGRKGI